jgi:hypothetical protein
MGAGKVVEMKAQQSPKTCANCGTDYFEGESCACGNPVESKPSEVSGSVTKRTRRDPMLWVIAIVIALMIATLVSSGGGAVTDFLGTAATYFAWAFGVTLVIVVVIGLLMLFSGLLLKAFWAVTYTAGNAWHSGRLAAEEGERSARRSS